MAAPRRGVATPAFVPLQPDGGGARGHSHEGLAGAHGARAHAAGRGRAVTYRLVAGCRAPRGMGAEVLVLLHPNKDAFARARISRRVLHRAGSGSADGGHGGGVRARGLRWSGCARCRGPLTPWGDAVVATILARLGRVARGLSADRGAPGSPRASVAIARTPRGSTASSMSKSSVWIMAVIPRAWFLHPDLHVEARGPAPRTPRSPPRPSAARPRGCARRRTPAAGSAPRPG